MFRIFLLFFALFLTPSMAWADPLDGWTDPEDDDSDDLDLESETEEEKKDYLASLGVVSSGLDQLVALGFDLLNLQCFLTAGLKESRSWVIPKGCKAPVAASVIHTDFERGFIRANVISYDQLMKVGSFKEAKEKGLLRQEGKDYVMQEGDVVEFLVQS